MSSEQMACLEVVNKDLSPVYKDTKDYDLVLFTDSSNQTVHIGCGSNLDGSATMQVTRTNIVANGNVTIKQQVLGSSNDSVALPSYTWEGNSNTGMYHESNNVIGFAANGTQIATLTPSNITVSGHILANGNVTIKQQVLGSSNDSVTLPTYTWGGNSNTGMYHESNNVIGFAANGTQIATLTPSNITVSGHILPTANISYDLGSSNARFRDLYLSGSTINIGETKLSVDQTNNLVVKDSSNTLKTLVVSEIQLGDQSTGDVVRIRKDPTTNDIKITKASSTGVETNSTTVSSSSSKVSMAVDMSDVQNIDLTKSWSVLGTVGPVWGAAVDGANNDTAVSVSINAADNIMIAGNYSNNTTVFPANSTTPSGFTLPTSSNGVFIVRYNTSGTPQWSAAIGGDSASNVVNQMTTDITNNTYVVGNYINAAPTVFNALGTTTVASTSAIIASPSNNNQSAYVVKYNDSGIAEWSAYTLNGVGPVSANAINVSRSTANVYVAGKYQSAAPTLYNGVSGPKVSVTTLAGSRNIGFQNVTNPNFGLQAGFNNPFSSCLDSSGTILYVADRANNRIRKIVLATGVVSTLAGSGTAGFADGIGTDAMFSGPFGICIDSTKSILYVTDRYNNRIRKITSLAGPNTGVVTTLAGSATSGAANGTGTSATFNNPYGICIDSTNTNLYVSEINNNSIRRVVVSTGEVTTVVSSGLNSPIGVCINSANSTLYVADCLNNIIRGIVISTGVMTTLAGSGTGTFADGTGTSASFNNPHGVCIDSTNSSLYVADGVNNRIRRIVLATGVVTTIAGSGTTTFADGTGTSARFNYPTGVCIDSTNSTLYVADQNSQRIRMVTSLEGPNTGVVTTIAGSGTATFADTISLDARFNSITGIAVNPTDPNTLYVADQNNCAIRSISTTTRTTTTWSGSAFTPLLASASRFNTPYFSCIDSTGTNMYVADYGSQRIRKIVLSTGAVTTVAGSGTGTFADGTGTSASFNNPTGICIDSTNSILYVSDLSNNRIRRIVIATGVVSTIAGSGTGTFADGTGTSASFSSPRGICIDSTNSTLYVADNGNNRIRKITSLVGPNTGVVTTIAGLGTASFADGTGTSACFSSPTGICIDSLNATLYVADMNNNRIRKITSLAWPNTGVVSTIAGLGTATFADGIGTSASFNNPAGICIDSTNSTLYVADNGNNRIRKITSLTGPNTGVVTTIAGSASSGATDGTGISASFSGPRGICIDSTNSTLYVTDYTNNRIRKITSFAGPNTGVVTTIAGEGIAGVVDTHLSRLNSPYGCCINPSGTIMYFSETGNNRIRMVVLSTGMVTTIAGSGTASFADGTGVLASFNNPRGICLDSTNSNLYVTDASNNRIRRIELSTGVVTTFAGSGTAGFQTGTGTNAQLNYPLAICIDTRNLILYVVEQLNNRVIKIVISTQAVTSFATGLTTSSSNFFNPTGICIDSAFENLYVSDASNNRICKVVIATQAVTRLAGSGQGSADGTGAFASFNTPYGLWYDTTSSSPALYVADYANSRVRKITSLAGPDTGVVTTITDSTGATASFNLPLGLCLDPSNQVLYVADSSNQRIRKVVLSPRDLTTLAGDGTLGYLDTKYNPSSICFDSSSNAYTTDYNYHVIRKISAVGRYETIFAGGAIGSIDGTGVDASFRNPVSICIDASSNFYVADQGNHTIRKITSAGVVTTLAGTAGTAGFTNGTGTTATFNLPSGVCVDTSGNVYIADTLNHSIRKITPDGVVTTLAGTNTSGYLDATGTNARFFNPVRVTCDNTGNVYVCDQGNRRIRMITPGGVVSTVVGRGEDGNIDGSGKLATFSRPTDIYVNPTGTTAYVTDSTENTVRRINIVTLPPLSSVSLPAPIASSQPAYIVKYDQSGISQFGVNINGAGSICEIISLAVDSSENFYITGTYTGTPTLSSTSGTGSITLRASDMAGFVAKYNSSGVPQWASVIDCISNDTMTSLAIDNTLGRVYVSGFYSNSSNPPVLYTSANTTSSTIVPSLTSGTQATFIASYDVNTGNPIWAAEIDGVGVETVNRVKVGADSTIYIVGQYSGAASSPVLYNADGSASRSTLPVPVNTQTKGFVAMYNQYGVVIDAMQVDGSGAQALNDVDIDSVGNIFVAGSYTTTTPVIYTNAAINNNTVTLPVPQNTSAYLVRYTKSNRASYNLESTLSSTNNGFTKYITNNGPTATTINVKVAGASSSNQFTFQLNPKTTSSLGWANSWFRFT